MPKVRKRQTKDEESALNPKLAKRWESLDMPSPFVDPNSRTEAVSELPCEERSKRSETAPLAGPLYAPDGRLITPLPPTDSGATPPARGASRRKYHQSDEAFNDDSVYDLVYKVPRK